MKASPLLFNIVKSLSPAEIAHFRQMASFQRGEKKFSRLFEHLTGLENYDEEEVKYFFKNDRLARNFASEKNELLHKILKSLRPFLAEQNPRFYIAEQLKHIPVLIQKQLPELALAELSRIKYIARENELFYCLIVINQYEINLLFLKNGLERRKGLAELIAEKNQLLSKITNLKTAEEKLKELTGIYDNFSFVRSGKEIAKCERLLSSKTSVAKSKKAEISLSLIKMLAAEISGKRKTLINTGEQTIRLFEENETMHREKQVEYALSCSLMARALITKGEAKKSFSLLDKMIALKAGMNYELNQFEIFRRVAIDESFFYLFTGQFEKHQKIVPQLLLDLDRLGARLSAYDLSRLHYYLFLSDFGLGRFAEAMQWLNRITAKNEKEVHPAVFRISKIMQIIVHYELEYTSMLGFLYTANQRLYDVRHDAFPFEKAFMKYSRKILLNKNHSFPEKDFKKLRIEMRKNLKKSGQEWVMEYFNFDAWIRAKIDGFSYAEAIRKEKKFNY